MKNKKEPKCLNRENREENKRTIPKEKSSKKHMVNIKKYR